MNRPAQGMGSKTTATERLVTLAERSNLPPRVRTLLEGMLAISSTVLEKLVVGTLNEFEQLLFKNAERARNNDLQARYFETLREVKRARSDVAPRFMQRLESGLAKLTDPLPLSDRVRQAGVPNKPQLALIESGELEQSLAVQDIATKTEIRHSLTLYALGHRFGVLAGSPAFDAEHLPIGPFQLCEMFRMAALSVEIQPEFRQMLFQQFERTALTHIGGFYDVINAFLVENRILPNFTVTPTRTRHISEEHAPAHRASGPLPDLTPSTALGLEPAAPPTSRPSGASPGAPPAAPGMAHSGVPGATTHAARPHGWDDSGAGQHAHAAHSGAPQERDSELFTTLRELLSGRRHALGMNQPVPAGAYQATNDDIQSVLGALQNKPIAPMVMGGKLVTRSVAHLKQDMLTQLRQFTPEGRAPRLADEDTDTIDLVGMLFDYITKDSRPNSTSQNLLAKLQVPVLRVALRDKSFFTRRQHPARQLLNSIAETGVHWLSDDDADRTLIEKMQLLVDRVTSEYDHDLGLFEDLLRDLSGHLSTLARKAEVTERRHVDAAKGREKLEVAREHASQVVAERMANAKPSRLLRALLEQAWTDVLALTILRQGEHSDAFHQRIGVAERLLAAGADEKSGFTSLAPAEAKRLRAEVESGLAQVGFHGDDILALVRRLFGEDGEIDDSASSQTELAFKLKTKARLGEDSAGDAAVQKPQLRGHASPPLNEDEQRTLQRVKTLPFGTWFEFSDNQQGDKVRRKLSWFSTVSGRCLFVNQRGIRAEERSLEQLAREIQSGRTKIVEANHESLIDRAWSSIMGMLKGFAGKAPSETPAH